jgi:hypothetical protein
MIILLPAREILVSDTPAGNGKIDNPFYSVVQYLIWTGLWCNTGAAYSKIHDKN